MPVHPAAACSRASHVCTAASPPNDSLGVVCHVWELMILKGVCHMRKLMRFKGVCHVWELNRFEG